MQKQINDQISFKTLWIFKNDDIEDKPSWKYLDHIVKRKKNKEINIHWIKNPHFAYKHLSPFAKGDITIEEARREFKWKGK